MAALVGIVIILPILGGPRRGGPREAHDDFVSESCTFMNCVMRDKEVGGGFEEKNKHDAVREEKNWAKPWAKKHGNLVKNSVRYPSESEKDGA